MALYRVQDLRGPLRALPNRLGEYNRGLRGQRGPMRWEPSALKLQKRWLKGNPQNFPEK